MTMRLHPHNDGARHPATHTMLALTALEGWVPRAEHTEVLDAIDAAAPPALVLRAIRALVPAAAHMRPRTSLLARKHPYLVRGMRDVLENSLGIYDADALADAEALCAIAAGTRILRGLVEYEDQVAQLHALLFGDVYAWAGLLRVVDLRKADSRFVPVTHLHREFPATAWPRVGSEDPVTDLGRWYAQYNYLHPFREGNGRAGGVALVLAARRVGLEFRFDRVGAAQWRAIAIGSMPQGRAVHPDPQGHIALLRMIAHPAMHETTAALPPQKEYE